jgi:hypothetical protein
MIGADLMKRIEALAPPDQVRVQESVLAFLKGAMASYQAGTLGERELICVNLIVNDALKELMAAAGYADFAAKTETALRARLAEMDGELQ